MALNLDVSKLTQSAAVKPTAHDNCIVLDLGTGTFPRDIEVRLPDDDGARQNALWDGSLNLAVNDVVLCFEYSGISAWRIMAMGGNDGGAGQVRVSEVWESDFGAVALQADATGQIEIGKTTGPDAKLDILDTAGTQLRLTFEDGVKFADLTSDTNHHLTIDPSSTGLIKLDATITVIDEIQHEGDADTKISFTDDDIEATVGGLSMLKLTQAAQDLITFGPGSGDVDIDFNAQMFLRGSDNQFGLGTNNPSGLVAGDVAFHLVSTGDTFPTYKMERTGGSSFTDRAWAFGVASGGEWFLQDLGVGNRIFVDTSGNVSLGITGATVGVGGIANVATAARTGSHASGLGLYVTATAAAASGGVEFRHSNGTQGIGIGFNTVYAAGSNTNQDLNLKSKGTGNIVLDPQSGYVNFADNFAEFSEMTAPAAGAANTCRLYVEDNGAGKTRLMAIFNTGAAQQVAIQP